MAQEPPRTWERTPEPEALISFVSQQAMTLLLLQELVVVKAGRALTMVLAMMAEATMAKMDCMLAVMVIWMSLVVGKFRN
jgi:hypothetical protein